VELDGVGQEELEHHAVEGDRGCDELVADILHGGVEGGEVAAHNVLVDGLDGLGGGQVARDARELALQAAADDEGTSSGIHGSDELALLDVLDHTTFVAIVEEVVAEDAVAENTDEAAEEDTTGNEAEAEVSEEIFDEVESTEATLVDAVEEGDELQSTRAQVAEWLEENVLNK